MTSLVTVSSLLARSAIRLDCSRSSACISCNLSQLHYITFTLHHITVYQITNYVMRRAGCWALDEWHKSGLPDCCMDDWFVHHSQKTQGWHGIARRSRPCIACTRIRFADKMLWQEVHDKHFLLCCVADFWTSCNPKLANALHCGWPPIDFTNKHCT